MEGKRAMVHAHAIRKTGVELLRWEEEDSNDDEAETMTFFRVSDEMNDDIMEAMAQIM